MLNTQTLASYLPQFIGGLGLIAFAVYYFLKLERATKSPAQLEAESRAAIRAAIESENTRQLAAARIQRTPRAWKHFER